MDANLPERLAVSVPEAAQMLGLSRSSAYEAARTGRLPTVRVGHRVLVPMTALRDWLDTEVQRSA